MIAIVPARGGSKGLPGKNIKQLHGKPLIAYTIEAALKSEKVSKVIISTDDDEIARIAVKYGAICPFLRPEKLAQDNSKAVDTYIYTVDKMNKEMGCEINDFVVLQPTSPLRTANDIDAAIALFQSRSADSVISYVKENHPFKWHKYLDDEGKFVDIFDGSLSNRQDLRTSYYPNGAVMVFKSSLIRSGQYYSDKSFAYLMPKYRSVDIDYIEDFEYVGFLLGRRHE